MLDRVMRFECFENAEKGRPIPRNLPVLLGHHGTCARDTVSILILVLIAMLNLNQKPSICNRIVQCRRSLQK